MSERDLVLKGATYKKPAGCGNLYITVNENAEGVPSELIVRMGKGNDESNHNPSCVGGFLEAIGRLGSACLRGEKLTLAEVQKHLTGVNCGYSVLQQGGHILSCPDAIAKVLRQHDEREKVNLVVPSKGADSPAIDNLTNEEKAYRIKHEIDTREGEG